MSAALWYEFFVPFYVKHPTTTETPVVVEVPHAGLTVDALAMATIAAPARCLGMDADLYVDDLYEEAPSLGATLLVSRVSRYVCDLNRGEQDVDRSSVETGGSTPAPHGLVWRLTTDGQTALTAPLDSEEFSRRLDTIYRPYHRTLTELLEAKKKKFGFVILLAAHSMPSAARAGHSDAQGALRACVVPGTRGRTSCAKRIIELPDRLARERGWSVLHDVPYRGGFTTANYGRPKAGQHAIQVELNRRLYMNEHALRKQPVAFEATRDYCSELVVALGKLTQADLG